MFLMLIFGYGIITQYCHHESNDVQLLGDFDLTIDSEGILSAVGIACLRKTHRNNTRFRLVFLWFKRM